MEGLFTSANLIALLTLTALEIVLGIDNVIFIALLSGKLPAAQQARARQLGIGLAVISRLLLLLVINYVINNLTNDVLRLLGNGVSIRDMILILGGAFLIGKSTYEIHDKLEGQSGGHAVKNNVSSLTSVLIQVMIIDVIFSLDSVITAVGIARDVRIMAFAIIVAAAVMLFFANAISSFVEKHPTMKILALAFLILIGVILVIEGWNSEAAHDLHIKNYAYFAMAFSVAVELINIRLRKAPEPPVKLRPRYVPVKRSDRNRAKA